LRIAEHKPFEQLVTGDELSADVVGLALAVDYVGRVVNYLEQVAGYVAEGYCRFAAGVTFADVVCNVLPFLDFFLEVFLELAKFVFFGAEDGHWRDEVLVNVLKEDEGCFLERLDSTAQDEVEVVFDVGLEHLFVEEGNAD